MEQQSQEHLGIPAAVSAKEKSNFLVERNKFVGETAAARRQAERVTALIAQLERLYEEVEWTKRDVRLLRARLNRTAHEFGIGASPILGRRAKS